MLIEYGVERRCNHDRLTARTNDVRLATIGLGEGRRHAVGHVVARCCSSCSQASGSILLYTAAVDAYDGSARQISAHLTDAQSLHVEHFVKTMEDRSYDRIPMGYAASLVDLMNWMSSQQLDVMVQGLAACCAALVGVTTIILCRAIRGSDASWIECRSLFWRLSGNLH